MSEELTTLPSRTAIALVARREMTTRLRSKMFTVSLATTIGMIFLIFGLGRFLDGDAPEVDVGVVGDRPSALDAILAAQEDDGVGVVTLTSYADRAAAEADLELGEIDAVVVDGTEVLVPSLSDDVSTLVLPAWQQARLLGELDDAGTDPAVVESALTPLTVTETETGDSRETKEGVAFAITIVLFLAIQFGGSFLMMGVLEEKGTKIVEMILSSIRARDLLLGKVIGIGVIGLIQVIAMAASAVIASGVFDSDALSVLDVPTLAGGLVWFLIGYVLWGTLFAAASSLATGMEDAQATVSPVSIAMVVSYFVSVYISANPSGIGRWLSWIPLVAPFSMPGRIASGDAAAWEVGATLALTVVTTYGVVRLAERTYVRSVLHTDSRVSWRHALGASR